MKQRVQDMDVSNKTVLLRCDFNVPIDNNQVYDDKKLVASLETINYLKEKNCKIIILSHLGKVKTEEDKYKYSLKPVADYLNKKLALNVGFYNGQKDKTVDRIKAMQAGEVLLLENTRFEDIPNKLESGNDIQLSMFYASLADLFINDAFGSCHRAHASTVGVAKLLPSGIGFLVQKELENLDKLINNPERPFTLIMGGAKIDDKIPMIKSLINECDYLLLAGGIANTFLAALNIEVGFSVVNKDLIPEVNEIMKQNKNKFMLPLDAIVGNNYDNNYVKYQLIDKVSKNDIIYDIGTKTIEKYKQAINLSKTIFVNGTMGMYEDKRFANGTNLMFRLLAESNATVIVGGGDSASAVEKLGYADKVDYISTGGGASLEYITNKSLPAIDVIKDVEK